MTRDDDPFSAEADPYPAEPAPVSIGRRTALTMVLAVPVLVSAAGCLAPRFSCETRSEDRASCRHRFCRFYRP
jgi:hypothetical protein